MGLLTDDEDLIDAALSEIMSLSIDVRHARDPEGAVEDILSNHFLAEVMYFFGFVWTPQRLTRIRTTQAKHQPYFSKRFTQNLGGQYPDKNWPHCALLPERPVLHRRFCKKYLTGLLCRRWRACTTRFGYRRLQRQASL